MAEKNTSDSYKKEPKGASSWENKDEKTHSRRQGQQRANLPAERVTDDLSEKKGCL